MMPEPMERRRALKLLSTGLLGGIIAGLTGIGGGSVYVPMLTSLGRLSQHVAHGTSLAIVVLVVLAAVARYASLGAIDWPATAMVAMGGVAGGYLGARAMGLISPPRLRQLFGLFLVSLGLYLLIVR